MVKLFELLNKLEGKFAKIHDKNVSMSELTVLSLQISPRQAIVLTNRNLYIYNKKIIKINAKIIPLQSIEIVRIKSDTLLIEKDNEVLSEIRFNKKKDLQIATYKKLTALLPGN